MAQARFLLIFILVGSISLVAQASKAYSSSHSSSSHSSAAGPHDAATKPISSKSAIALPHKSAVTMPKTENNGTELAKLERQNARVGNSGKASSQGVKPVAIKREEKSSGSGINASYQKPKVNRK